MRDRALHALTAAGLADADATSFVYAINEATTNAIVHGGGTGELIWSVEGDRLRAEVRDSGLVEPFGVPTELPPPAIPGGRGLWLAQELSDRIGIRADATGTGVTLEVSLPAHCPDHERRQFCY